MKAAIGFLVPALVRTGPVNVLMNVVREVASHGRIAIASLSTTNDPQVVRDAMALGARVACFAGRKWNLMSAREFVREWCEMEAVGVISAHGLRPTVLAVHVDAPSVVTVHSEIGQDFQHEYGPFAAKFGTFVYAHVLRRATSVLAVSGGVQEHLAAMGVRSEVVRNGVDCAYWRYPSAHERHAARLRFGLSSQRVAAVVGRLIERKDPLRAIEVARSVVGPNGVVLVAGDGELRDAVARVEHVPGLASLHVLGAVDDVRAVYWASDLYVSAARSEGLPMAAIEAAATGLPLMLSDISAHREIGLALPGVVTDLRDCEAQAVMRSPDWTADRDGRAAMVASSQLSSVSMGKAYLRHFQRVNER